jgi:hypothetical protein
MLPASAGGQKPMQMASATAMPPVKTGPADVTLHIGPVLVDVTKDKTISQDRPRRIGRGEHAQRVEVLFTCTGLPKVARMTRARRSAKS